MGGYATREGRRKGDMKKWIDVKLEQADKSICESVMEVKLT